MSKRFMSVSLSVVLALAFVFPLWAAPVDPLGAIIEGAKKEGTVSAMLRTGFTPKSMERLAREIKEKFGVGLNIRFTPNYNMPKELGLAIMEYKTGSPPTYDVMNFMSSHITQGIKEGVLEKVNWESLLIPGTPRNVLLGSPPQDDRLNGYGLINNTGRFGVMYNPKRVSPQEFPKTLGGLADPKWKGKVAVFNYPNSWVRMAFVQGKEKIFSNLRAILKNEAIQGAYADEYNRFLLGEVWLALLNTVYFKMAVDKGVPAAWQGIDPVDITHFSLVVRKGTKHPNAARLIALYLSSPEGSRFTLEESGAGNYLIPGNFEYDIHQQEVKQGLRHVTAEQREVVDFEFSKEFSQWEKEIKLIFDTGGEK